MSLLTPLYIAGALAIALPILFHLIRRTPQGRQPFSSLMFLSPSPPRVTRRSRLNNIFLLLLRATALLLLAFAFARPLLRQGAYLDVTEGQGRRVAILLDTSGSMQRGDLWRQALAHVDTVLAAASPLDELSLYTFDRQARVLVSQSEYVALDPSRRAALVKARLAEVNATWSATNLGDALASVADALADSTDANAATVARQVVLISDLQQGSRLESLQGYQWPEGVLLDVRPVALAKSADAAVSLVKDATDAEDDAPAAQDKLRIRVSNQPNSTREQFSLTWHDEKGPIQNLEPIVAYVPPGTSRILRVAWPESPANRLLLAGDDHSYDNTLYLVPPRQEHLRLVYLGDEAADDAQGLRFFLETAAASNPRRTIDFVARGSQATLATADLIDARLVVAVANITADQLKALHPWIGQGGTLLCVLKSAGPSEGIASLLGVESIALEESAGGDHALLGEIAFDHPLFASMADPRFSDFTRIRFWKHRRVTLPADHAARVLARFDNGDPFVLEHTIGEGRLLIFTSGWHPSDSQLARSTKFVPLISELLDRPRAGYEQPQHTVDEPIELPPADDGPRTVINPAGETFELKNDADQFVPDRPGLYRLSFAGQNTTVAVNPIAEESRTAPLGVEELESRGARLGSQPTLQEVVQRQRQLRLIELENRQKMWRWLIVSVLGVLVLEMGLAGYLTRRSLTGDAMQPTTV